MSRKNIFKLVDESYNIQDEIKKINKLFINEEYFQVGFEGISFKTFIKDYLFENWDNSDTCLTLDEFLVRANANISYETKNSEDVIINNLEVIENFVKLYFDCKEDYRYIERYYGFTEVFCKLIYTLEKRMGLTKREYKDIVILYPKNAPLEKVVDLCGDEDVQWELIRYVREDLSLSEKRKSLAYLATNLYIEEDKTETNEHIKEIIKKTSNILNNLHIRHNNKTGKWENKVLENLDEEDAILLCDMVYNEMLTIVLLREHKGYEKTYEEFNKKQKEAKAEKKAEADKNEQT